MCTLTASTPSVEASKKVERDRENIADNDVSGLKIECGICDAEELVEVFAVMIDIVCLC